MTYLAAVDLDLVGTSEIATMLGITRTRVNQLARDDKTFPAPVAELSIGRVWNKADVEAWARRTGRLDK